MAFQAVGGATSERIRGTGYAAAERPGYGERGGAAVECGNLLPPWGAMLAAPGAGAGVRRWGFWIGVWAVGRRTPPVEISVHRRTPPERIGNWGLGRGTADPARRNFRPPADPAERIGDFGLGRGTADPARRNFRPPADPAGEDWGFWIGPSGSRGPALRRKFRRAGSAVPRNAWLRILYLLTSIL
jgi:hypothetical protein